MKAKQLCAPFEKLVQSAQTFSHNKETAPFCLKLFETAACFFSFSKLSKANLLFI